ncbi:unnamed protein product, partial [Hapterophycus canaliculatus]
LPHPPEPPSPSLLRSLDESSVTDLCEICGFDTEPDNLIVYCESCNMGVHQTCYGISEVRCGTLHVRQTPCIETI